MDELVSRQKMLEFIAPVREFYWDNQNVQDALNIIEKNLMSLPTRAWDTPGALIKTWAGGKK